MAKKAKATELTEAGFEQIQKEVRRDPINHFNFIMDFVNPGMAVPSTNDEDIVINGFKMDKLPDGKLYTVKDNCDVVFNWDLQPRDITDGSHLIEDIQFRGLVTEPTAWVRPDGATEILMGHLRLDALARLQSLDMDAFKELFPKGVPIKVYEDLTEEQAMLIRDDHDLDNLKRKLTSRVEIFHLLRPKFEKMWTESKILKTDWRSIAATMSRKYAALEKEVAGITDAKKQYERIFDSQKGNLQFLKAIYRNPVVLQQYWMDSERADEASIKQADIQKLATEFEEECKIALASGKKYSKVNPGPTWTARFEELKAEAAAPAADKRTPFTQKQRTELSNSLQSEIAGFVIHAIENEQDYALEQLRVADSMIAPIEAALKKNPEIMNAMALAILNDEDDAQALVDKVKGILLPAPKSTKKKK